MEDLINVMLAQQQEQEQEQEQEQLQPGEQRMYT
jgi:hypothetical protein